MHNTSMQLSKDLVAASAAPLILALLEEADSYGYAIIQSVRELSDGEIEWTDGMLYPALTRQGRKALAAQKNQWQFMHRMLTKVWGG
jgi:PadR family transcriptional regulator PadR